MNLCKPILRLARGASVFGRLMKHFIDAVEAAGKADGRNYFLEAIEAIKPCFERGSACQIALVAVFRLLLAYLSGVHGGTAGGGDMSPPSTDIPPPESPMH
jgi:hypothetical protein